MDMAANKTEIRYSHLVWKKNYTKLYIMKTKIFLLFCQKSTKSDAMLQLVTKIAGRVRNSNFVTIEHSEVEKYDYFL